MMRLLRPWSLKAGRFRNLYTQSNFPPHPVTCASLCESLPEISQLDPALNNRQAIYDFSVQQPDKFWGTLAKSRIEWMTPFHTVQDCRMEDGHFSWFLGGELNVSVNCVDRHAIANPEKTALIWEKDEPGQQESVTYSELLALVSKIGNVLLSLGVQKGDRVILYVPMSPLSVACMLACTRIGAVHSVVFAGFSASALAARANDAGAKVIITADQAIRGGKKVELKATVDTAMRECPNVERVLVITNSGAEVNMGPKDIRLEREMDHQNGYCPPMKMGSEDPLFMLYTSGSTGKPKGIIHAHAGYLLGAALSHSLMFDVRENDVFGCVADIGWITGHNHVVYGPLASGGTSLLFESVPTYPNAGRYWETVERLKLTHFYGAPTALRLLLKYGDEWPKRYDRSSLRVLGSVGEPINQEAWRWLHDVVGEAKCMLVDTWWQTETGAIIIAPTPADSGDPIIPTMAMRPSFGIVPLLMDEKGNPKSKSSSTGALCIQKPWPSMARTIYGDHERFVNTYFKQYPGYYFTGDGGAYNEDGYITITGRMDDVINISGHRLGTAEIENILDEHPDVSEAAVVSIPHEIKGEGLFAFVILKDDVIESNKNIIQELKNEIAKKIAKFAVPESISIVPGLPKTRSGKIMRRILRKIACGETAVNSFGDISTLAEPAVVAQILESVNEHNNSAKHYIPIQAKI